MTNYNERLDEVLFNLTDLSYASFTTQEEADRVADQLDYDRAKAKQALIDWHNRQVEEVLDRLESTAAYGTDIEEYAEDVLSAIEVERNKLKERDDD